MLEYVFFDPRPRDQFIAGVHELGVQTELKEKGEELLVLLSDDLDQVTADAIEECFMATLSMSEALMAEAEGVDSFDTTGVEVKLKDGTAVIASVDAKVLGKVLSVLNYGELSHFVDSITSAVENPDQRALCKR